MKKRFQFVGSLLCVGVLVGIGLEIYWDLSGRNNAIFKELLKGQISANDSRLISYVLNHVLKPPSQHPYNLTGYIKRDITAGYKPYVFLSRHLKLLFEQYGNGFFVEAGGLDGEMISNTLWLERKKNWTGLLIEPDVANFREMQTKHRKCWTAQGCLSVNSYPEEVIFFSPVAPNRNPHEYPFRWMFKGNIHPEKNGVPFRFDDFGYNFVAQCYPLETLLMALDVHTIDLFSLDIQGGELNVLKNFPWGRIAIKSLIVEYISKSAPLISFIESKGLTLWTISPEPDFFFLNKSDPYFKHYLNLHPNGIAL